MKTISIIKDSKTAKKVESMNYYDVAQFCKDGKRFVNALRSGRLVATITKVSANGMRRYIKFVELSKCAGSSTFYAYNFNAFLTCLGYKVTDNSEVIKNGCGMDMVFDTTNGVINTLHWLGMLTAAECAKYQGLMATRI